MNRRRASVLSMLVAPLLLMMGLTVSSAQASATNIVNIPGELDACKGVAQNVGLTKHGGGFNAGVYNTFGKSYPVILVHGYEGENKGRWGDLDEATDLAARIDNVSNAVVATEFQYHSSNDYVLGGVPPHFGFTNHIQPLANAIHCIATISRGNGGPGKVIVVGYSEGSALAHGAATKKSADGSRVIGDEIGQAVTVADARISYPTTPPLFGVVRWPIFNEPDFPSNVTVHSIGANIINAVREKNGSISNPADTHGWSHPRRRCRSRVVRYSGWWRQIRHPVLPSVQALQRQSSRGAQVRIANQLGHAVSAWQPPPRRARRPVGHRRRHHGLRQRALQQLEPG